LEYSLKDILVLYIKLTYTELKKIEVISGKQIEKTTTQEMTVQRVLATSLFNST